MQACAARHFFPPRSKRTLPVLFALVLAGLPCFSAPVGQDRAVHAASRWLEYSPSPMGGQLGSLGAAVACANSSGEVRFYAINLSPVGYIVVSADDELEPILAFSSTGRFTAEAGNPLYDVLLKDTEGREQHLRAASAGRQAAISTNAGGNAKWRLLDTSPTLRDAVLPVAAPSDVRVAPLVQSVWDQDTVWNGSAYVAVFNYYTPPGAPGDPNNDVSGCVATAWAQIMRYHQWPIAGVGMGTYPIWVDGVPTSAKLRGGDGSGGPYDWADMVLTPGTGVTPVQSQAIGALVYDAGIASNMSYTLGDSSADLDSTAIRKTFHYANAADSAGSLADVTLAIRANLDAGLPVVLSIFPTPATEGHVVVCDGYGYDIGTLYDHLNFGWGGLANTWYNLPDAKAGGADYDTVTGLTYNIDPTVAGEIVSGRITDSLGSPAAGVAVTAKSGPATHSTTTNQQGIFFFKGLASGTTWSISRGGGTAVAGPSSVNVTTGTSGEYTPVGDRVVDNFQVDALAIAAEGGNSAVTAGGTVVFTAAAQGAPVPALLWQVSVDGGNTWTNLSDTGPYAGTATGTLTISGVTAAMTGTEYRCVASNSAQGSATSNVELLTVITPGSVWAMGDNTYGQLGDGSTTQQAAPELILPGGARTVAAGEHHSLIVMTDGSLWAMGKNDKGELGDGTTTGRDAPVQVLSGGVQAVAAGWYHSLILKTDGSLWAVGDNSYGELGDGTYTQRSVPVEILPSGVRSIAAGAYHSLFVMTDGSLWGMGYGGSGQIGPLGGSSTLYPFSPVKILSSGVQAVAAGYEHSLIVMTDGSLWAMGDNAYGDLGDGTTTQRNTPVKVLANGVQSVAAGWYHSLFVMTNGSLWGVGYNSFGELGDGTTTQRSLPVEVLSGGVQSAAAGDYHSLIVKTDGSLWGMGYNETGQLGDGTASESFEPELIAANGQATAPGSGYSLFVAGGDISSYPKVTVQPAGKTTSVGSAVSFSVTVTGVPVPACQWEMSTDSGASWADVPPGGAYSGGTTSTLTVSGPTASMSGYQYRCVITSRVASVTSGAATLTVKKLAQTISFPAIGNKVYGAALINLGVTDTSGLPVGLSIVSGPATFVGSSLMLTGTGTVILSANQPGNTTYAAAAQVVRSFVVSKAAQTINFSGPAGIFYGASPVNLAATASSGLPVTLTVLGGPARFFGNALTPTGGGIVTVRATQAGDSNYKPAVPVTRYVTFVENQTITFAAPPNKTFGAAAFSLSATATSGLTVTFSVVSGPAKVLGKTVTLTGAGAVTIRASQAGDAYYLAAPAVDRTFTVAKAAQTITFPALGNKAHGAAAFAISATASSGLAVTFKISIGPATISGSKVTLTGSGTVTIQASQAGNANYLPAAPVSRSFTVGN